MTTTSLLSHQRVDGSDESTRLEWAYRMKYKVQRGGGHVQKPDINAVLFCLNTRNGRQCEVSIREVRRASST